MKLNKQLDNHELTTENIIGGFKRFICGLLKKVLIADTCGEIANQVFMLPANALGFDYAWLGSSVLPCKFILIFPAIQIWHWALHA